MREKEIQWLRDHQDQVERLQGKWIAVEGDILIAEGDIFNPDPTLIGLRNRP